MDAWVSRLYREDTTLHKEAQRCFGKEVIKLGVIDRNMLRALFCAQNPAWDCFEEVVHQRVFAWMLRETQEYKGVLIESPLLSERSLSYFSRIVVVDAERELRHARALQRGYTQKEWLAITRRQLSRYAYIRLADDIVSTARNTEESMRAQVDRLGIRYRQFF
tara:strand:+ start:1321 stop:1809 length:489 start_codon:yes stop_codon:yes gene_type:complete